MPKISLNKFCYNKNKHLYPHNHKPTHPSIHTHMHTLTFLLLSGPSQQLVEDVECALILGLPYGSGFLKEVSFNVGTSDVARVVKVDPDKFALKHTRLLVLPSLSWCV